MSVYRFAIVALAAILCAGCPDAAVVDCGTHVCPVNTTCTPTGCFGGAGQAVCGNSTVEAPEACDDGNQDFGDGCSALCDSDERCGNGVVDPLVGEACDPGLGSGEACRADCTVARCGDGIVDAANNEACDMGPDNSSEPDAACRPDCRVQRCGDGVVDQDEICDDGNSQAGDGCAPTCLSAEACGDSVVNVAAGEVCDDGNWVAGDGCSADCRSAEVCRNGILDPGEVCDDGNLVAGDGCAIDCSSMEECGNGILDTATGETCDDGNTDETDLCLSTCRGPVCGDGVLQPPQGEACDAGPLNADVVGAPCRSNCQLPRCGDGVLELDELCDDGNVSNGDGCSSDCQSLEVCGNGRVDPGEECDSLSVWCHSDCQLARCGDGILDAALGESCDAGFDNADTPDAACRSNCQPLRCGDGVIDTGEVCDDGNTASADGCAATCQSDETCGNHVLDFYMGETCDDEYVRGRSGDGCSSRCLVENWQVGIVAALSDSVVHYHPGNGSLYHLQQHDGVTRVSEWPAGDPAWRIAPDFEPGTLQWVLSVFDTNANRLLSVAGDYTIHTYDPVTKQQAILPRTTVPSLQAGPTVFDSARNRIIHFRPQVWEYDLTSKNWFLRGSSPTAWVYEASYDPQRNVTVVVTADRKTWDYDGAGWIERGPIADGSTSFSLQAMLYDPTVGRTIAMEGDRTFEFDGVSGSWTSFPVGPTYGDLAGNQPAFDGTRGAIVLATDTKLRWYDAAVHEWRYQDTAPSPGQTKPTLDEARHRLVTLGWQFDLLRFRWEPLALPISGGEAIVYDRARSTLVLTGGGATWEFAGTWNRVATVAPPGRKVYAGAGRILAVSGPSTWLYDGYQHSWTVVNTMAPTVVAMAYNTDANLVYAIEQGGQLWIFDMTNHGWSLSGPSFSESQSQYVSIVYDETQHTLIAWEGDNRVIAVPGQSEWAPVAPTAVGGDLVYDRVRQRALLVNGPAISKVYRGLLIQGTDQCLDSSLDTDQDGLFGCGDATQAADPDCTFRCTPTCSPVESCDLATQPHCGDGFCDNEFSLEDAAICPQDCS